MDDARRLDAEWVTVNAIRGMRKIATKGNVRQSTYDDALQLGAELYPELLGPETSLLWSARESNTLKEYRQRARFLSVKLGSTVSALDLIDAEVVQIEELLRLAKAGKHRAEAVDQLKRKHAALQSARTEMVPTPHTENQIIVRDATRVPASLPSLKSGQAYLDYRLPDGNVLRVRMLHPDRPEHISGADIIYERHNLERSGVSLVAVQYKIWDGGVLRLSDQRMQDQLSRLRDFACNHGLCVGTDADGAFRFPFCSAFLRPTDKLQRAGAALISSGEHIPICLIDGCASRGDRGAQLLEYGAIKDTSLSAGVFEDLFNRGKVGSRLLSHDELRELYAHHAQISGNDVVILYAQEIAEDDGDIETEV